MLIMIDCDFHHCNRIAEFKVPRPHFENHGFRDTKWFFPALLLKVAYPEDHSA